MADGREVSANRRETPQGPVCVIARAEVRSGAGGQLAALLSDLAHSVRSEEAGCTSYAVTRPIGSSSHFAVHARFTDWRAFESHAETVHMKSALPRISALLAAPVALEIFLEL